MKFFTIKWSNEFKKSVFFVIIKLLYHFRGVNDVSSKTLAQIVDTEQATKDLSDQYTQKRQALDEGKNRKISEKKSENEKTLEHFRQSLVEENQAALQAYKDEQKAKSDQEIKGLEEDFQRSLPELVSIVMEEVKLTYGNR